MHQHNAAKVSHRQLEAQVQVPTFAEADLSQLAGALAKKDLICDLHTCGTAQAVLLLLLLLQAS